MVFRYTEFFRGHADIFQSPWKWFFPCPIAIKFSPVIGYRLIHCNTLKFQDKPNSYEPVQNLRYNIHGLDLTLIFPK